MEEELARQDMVAAAARRVQEAENRRRAEEDFAREEARRAAEAMEEYLGKSHWTVGGLASRFQSANT